MLITPRSLGSLAGLCLLLLSVSACPPPPEPNFGPGATKPAEVKPGEVKAGQASAPMATGAEKLALSEGQYADMEAAIRCIEGQHRGDADGLKAATAALLKERKIGARDLERSRQMASADQLKTQVFTRMIEQSTKRLCPDGKLLPMGTAPESTPPAAALETAQAPAADSSADDAPAREPELLANGEVKPGKTEAEGAAEATARKPDLLPNGEVKPGKTEAEGAAEAPSK